MTPIPPPPNLPSSLSSGPMPQSVEVLTKWTHEEPEEPIRYTPTIPKLPSHDPKNAAIQAGDWLASLGPVMSSLSATAGTWWNDSLGCAERSYQVWVKSSPLDRIRMPVTTFSIVMLQAGTVELSRRPSLCC